MEINDNFGIVYGASSGGTPDIKKTGKHVSDEVQSAESIKSFYPDVQITLFTDYDEKCLIKHFEEEELNGHPYMDVGVFTNVVLVKDSHPRNKFDAMINSPYEKTLYLDNDTCMKKPVISNMIQLLDRFDICATHASMKRIVVQIDGIPKSFPELNSGVLLYNKNCISLFKDWQRNWKNNILPTNPNKHDQPYLRQVIWESNLKIYILPEEYNVRPGRTEAIHQVFIYHAPWGHKNNWKH